MENSAAKSTPIISAIAGNAPIVEPGPFKISPNVAAALDKLTPALAAGVRDIVRRKA